MAGNLAIDTLRREQRLSANVGDVPEYAEAVDPAPPPEAVFLAKERLGILDDALQQLSPNARQALLLNRLEGLTQAQIAVELGVSESMVAKYIGQALRHCRDWLKHNHA
ncbi:putative RNA polymerase sigma factor FecI [compost metagenome]